MKDTAQKQTGAGHTPVPWTVKGLCSGDYTNKDYATGKANVDFIVQAVNSHDKLVEALSGLLEAQVCPLGQSKADRWSLACDKARAALALAGVDKE